MAKNNKEYWEKREEEKLNKGIKDCNKLAKDLQSHYKKAYKEIEKEINNLFCYHSDYSSFTTSSPTSAGFSCCILYSCSNIDSSCCFSSSSLSFSI